MRAKLSAVAVGLVVLAYASPASAQVSIWLQRGVSGFGGSLQLQAGEDYIGYGVSGGYSWRGTVDADLALRRTFFDDETFAGATDVEAYGILPSVQVHPLKQSADMPVSLGLSAGFEYQFLESDDFEAVDYEIDGWAIHTGANVYRFFRLGERTGIIPTAGLFFTHTSISDNRDNTETDDNIRAEFGGYFAILMGQAILGIAPFVGIGEDVAFGISFGVVVSRPPDE